MEIDRTFNYSKTNITKIVNPPQIENDNFISIIEQYDSQLKNNLEPDKIPIAQKNIFKIDDFMHQNNNQVFINQNEGEMQDSDEEMNDQMKMVEITSSGNIQIKRNKNFINKNDKSEDNNNYLDFDNKAESISMTNNNIFINNSINNKNYDFMLQDNPININDDDDGYSYKWRKIFEALRQKYNHIIKNNFLSILQGLIISKKNNEKIKKIEIEEINYNIGEKNRKIKSRNESNINNTTKNSIKDSDTRTSYDNLTKIVTTTQINNLTSSINSLSNSNLNIPQQEINIQKELDEEEKEIIKDSYQPTDISKVLNVNNIFTPEKFKNLIDFLQYKDDLFMKKFTNDSSNVRISLNSSIKKKDYGNIYTINEEDNESYDSYSLQKSLKNSKKVTPSKLDIKKNSFKDIRNIINNSNNNNFDNLFINKDIPDINLNNIGQKNYQIEEIRIGKNDDDNLDDEKIVNNNIIKDININLNNSIKNKNKNEKKILSIDLDMNLINTNKINNIRYSNQDNEDLKVQNNDRIEEDINDDKMIISDNENEEKEDKDKIINFTTPKSKEKTIDKIYENINGDNNIKPGPKEFINFDNNIQIKFPDFNNVLNNNEKFEEDKKEELEEKKNKNPKEEKIKEKNENKEFLNNDEDNENKEKNKYIQKTKLIKASENNENDETFKKSNDTDKNKLEYSDNNIENEDINDNDNENSKEDNIINENEELNINHKDKNKNNIKIKCDNYDINIDNNFNNKKGKENEINIDDNMNNINIDDELNTDNIPNININNEKYNEKVILSSTIIQNINSDSLNDYILSPKSSVNIINTEKENSNNDINGETKSDIFSNKISLSSNLSSKDRQTLFNKFIKYKVIDSKNRKVLFLGKEKDIAINNDNMINENNTNEMPFFSYLYILKLCIGIKINLSAEYEIFINKLIFKLEKSKMLNSKKLEKKKKNKKIEDKINTEIYNFDKNLKSLRKIYKNLIEKRSSLNSKKEKEKLMKEADITNKRKDTYLMFINLLFLIKNNIINDQIKFNSYKEKLMNILKRNHKINKNKMPISNKKKLKEQQKEDKKNNYHDSGNVDFEERNLEKVQKKSNSKKMFFLISFTLPFFYAMNYFMKYIKPFE